MQKYLEHAETFRHPSAQRTHAKCHVSMLLSPQPDTVPLLKSIRSELANRLMIFILSLTLEFLFSTYRAISVTRKHLFFVPILLSWITPNLFKNRNLFCILCLFSLKFWYMRFYRFHVFLFVRYSLFLAVYLTGIRFNSETSTSLSATSIVDFPTYSTNVTKLVLILVLFTFPHSTSRVHLLRKCPLLLQPPSLA